MVAGHRQQLRSSDIAGSRRRGTLQNFMRTSMAIPSHAQRFYFWAAVVLPGDDLGICEHMRLAGETCWIVSVSAGAWI